MGVSRKFIEQFFSSCFYCCLSCTIGDTHGWKLVYARCWWWRESVFIWIETIHLCSLLMLDKTLISKCFVCFVFHILNAHMHYCSWPLAYISAMIHSHSLSLSLLSNNKNWTSFLLRIAFAKVKIYAGRILFQSGFFSKNSIFLHFIMF